MDDVIVHVIACRHGECTSVYKRYVVHVNKTKVILSCLQYEQLEI